MMPRKWMEIVRAILVEEGLREEPLFSHGYPMDGYDFVLGDSAREPEMYIYRLKDDEKIIALLGKYDIHAVLVPETREQSAYVRIPKVYDDRDAEDIRLMQETDRITSMIFGKNKT